MRKYGVATSDLRQYSFSMMIELIPCYGNPITVAVEDIKSVEFCAGGTKVLLRNSPESHYLIGEQDLKTTLIMLGVLTPALIVRREKEDAP